ncbi:MAG: DUF1826 domain-containing protein [Bacteroidota bacterium]
MKTTHLLQDNAIICKDVKRIQDIHLKTKNVVVYQRGIAALEGELVQAVKLPIEFRTTGTVEEITFSLSNYFARVLLGYVRLLEDILHLLELFEQVTKVSSFRIVLATVTTTMCPRFHADNNELRMLCTYSGPGTLWLPDHAVDRKAYHRGKGNQNILPDEGCIQQADTGDVVILKGALYPGATPVLHRSPNIKGKEEERLLLSIDNNESLQLSL